LRKDPKQLLSWSFGEPYWRTGYLYLLLFNVILSSIFISFWFILIILYLNKTEQRETKIEPRIKLNYNISMKRLLDKLGELA